MASLAISLLDDLYNRASSTVTSRSWGPLVSISRSAIVGLLKNLEVGQLELHTSTGVWKFGDPTLTRAKENKRNAAQTNGDGVAAGATVATPPTKGGAAKSKTARDPIAAAKTAIKIKASQPPHAIITVKDDAFWVRMFLGADLGFAESYMLGEVETADLGACFNLFIQNRTALGELSTGIVSSVTSWIQGQLNKRYANTKSGSLKNIGAHYDISNAMYEAFLSADMTYSSGVYPTLDADETGPLLASILSAAAAEPNVVHTNGHTDRTLPATNGNGTAATAAADVVSGAARHLAHQLPLAAQSHEEQAAHQSGAAGAGGKLAEDELEDAQIRKLRLHIARANIRKGDHVLEIGTGWGSFSMEAVRTTGCTVDTLTLSVEQKALAEQRIAAAGMSNSIKVHLMDYRDMPASWTDRFDRIVSIEMLEAVGIEFMPTYFACLDRVLKARGGAVSIQCITMPEVRFAAYASQTDFIRKWIFPGGVLPSVTAIINAVEQGSSGRLVLDTAHSIGPHYARTLREWRHRFEHNFDEFVKPALLMDHEEIRGLAPAEQAKQVEVFRRKWICEFPRRFPFTSGSVR